jgi:hypothetical protein
LSYDSGVKDVVLKELIMATKEFNMIKMESSMTK